MTTSISSTGVSNSHSLSFLAAKQLAMGAFMALSLFSVFQRYRHRACERSKPRTDVRNYVILTPNSCLLKPKTREEQRAFYTEAKKALLAFSKELASHVHFNDKRLQIGFDYCLPYLRYIGSQLEKSGYPALLDVDQSGFRIKGFDKAYSKFEKQAQDLDKESREAFDHFSPKVSPVFKKEISSTQDLFSTIFEKSNGVIFTDLYNAGTLHFTITHLQELVKQGVEAIFIDRFSCEVQKDLDSYFGPQTKLEEYPLALKSEENEYAISTSYSTYDLIWKAKQAGIKRVISLDSMICALKHDEDSYEKRLRLFNYFAKGIIEKEMPEGKFVILANLSFATTQFGVKVPGLTQLLGIPTVLFRDNSFFSIDNRQGEQTWIVAPGNTTNIDTIYWQYDVDFCVDIPLQDQVKLLTEKQIITRLDEPKTDFMNSIFVSPVKIFDGQITTSEWREESYQKAKKEIQSYPKEILSHIDFHDHRLEIGFRYNINILTELIRHFENKWLYGIIEDDPGCLSPITYHNVKPTLFFVKDYEIARDRIAFLKHDLYQDAILFFSRFIPKKPPSFQNEVFLNYGELLSAIFEKSKGLSIADIHSSTAPIYFLATYMNELVKCGVETLFLEGFQDNMQKDLDAYFDPKTDVESLPFSLAMINKLCGLWTEIITEKNGYTELDVLKIAKKAGIKRIVGLGNIICAENIRLNVDDESSNQRVYTFNYYAKNIIEKEMPKGKYVIFSGFYHAVTVKKDGSVPGFSEIFGIPSIFFRESLYSQISNTQAQESWYALKGNTIDIETISVSIDVDFMVDTSPDEQQKPREVVIQDMPSLV